MMRVLFVVRASWRFVGNRSRHGLMPAVAKTGNGRLRESCKTLALYRKRTGEHILTGGVTIYPPVAFDTAV